MARPPREARPVGGHKGYTLAETADTVALAKRLQEWSDLLEFDVQAVNNDENVMKVLGS